MEQIQTMIPSINTEKSYIELLQMTADSYNSKPGTLDGYDCKICKNKGEIAKVVGEDCVRAECECMKIRDTLDRIRRSGLEELFRKSSFKNYECTEKWQQEIMNDAIGFLKDGKGGMFMGGQSGSGKTHLCTAVVGGFIKKGLTARYFVWREHSLKLKAIINEKDYTPAIDDFKKTDVLYIDDLFMQDTITDADIKLAFEIIDYRLRNNLMTIISTNLSLDELLDINEPLGSRIVEMTAAAQIYIKKDRRKNYRLKKRR